MSESPVTRRKRLLEEWKASQEAQKAPEGPQSPSPTQPPSSTQKALQGASEALGKVSEWFKESVSYDTRARKALEASKRRK